MSRARIELQPAYVLAQRAYRETSQLVEAFTPAHGRIGLVARGTRGPKSRLRGLLVTFQPLLLSWTESGELGTLIAAESSGRPLPLEGERVFHGWYLNELLTRLLQRHDPHPALYAVYEHTLRELAGAQGEAALRLFELQLLAELGYGLPLAGALDPARRYRFDFERGPQPLPPEAQDGYAGASLIALREARLDSPEALRAARRLLRPALARHLGGRELETPKLLRALRAGARPARD
jgi:DNA repair protein RecO (recombination protein O)